jgi:polyhydroxybutyrate depolymerase
VPRLRRSLGLDNIARSTGAAIVYPIALHRRWNIGKADAPPTNDALFVRAIARKLIADGVADRRRIFLAGVSSGGVLAMRLACESAELFAGVAAVGANLPADVAPACKPSKPVRLLLINGTGDPVMPYNGGKSALDNYKDAVVSTDATLAPFAAAAGCSGRRSRSELADRDKRDRSRAVVEKFAGCKATVELIRIEGGGHTIPGRRRPPSPNRSLGAQNDDIDTAHVIMDFFRRRS